jgi:hypothetical protein
VGFAREPLLPILKGVRIKRAHLHPLLEAHFLAGSENLTVARKIIVAEKILLQCL